jgi:hypothetical protein
MSCLHHAVVDLVSLKPLACLIAQDDPIKQHRCPVATLLGGLKQCDCHLGLARTRGGVQNLRSFALGKALAQGFQRLLLVVS